MENAKTTIGLIAAITFSAGAHAEPSNHKICSSWSILGETAAEVRYEGQPLRETIRLAKEDWDENELIVEIIRGAYQLTDFETDESQQKAATEYGNTVYEECMKILEQADNE